MAEGGREVALKDALPEEVFVWPGGLLTLYSAGAPLLPLSARGCREGGTQPGGWAGQLGLCARLCLCVYVSVCLCVCLFVCLTLSVRRPPATRPLSASPLPAATPGGSAPAPPLRARGPAPRAAGGR